MLVFAALFEMSCRTPQYGRMNLPIRYSRFSVVLRPTSCVAFQRSIHSLTVISPAAGSFHVPARTFASWSRPQTRAACFVSKPDSLASPPGTLYLTRHGRGPLPRFSAYATALPPLGCSFLRRGSGSGCLVWAVASAGCYVCGSRVAGHPRPRSARCRHHLTGG